MVSPAADLHHLAKTKSRRKPATSKLPGRAWAPNRTGACQQEQAGRTSSKSHGLVLLGRARQCVALAQLTSTRAH